MPGNRGAKLTPNAAIAQSADGDKFLLLAAALAQSHFWQHLESARRLAKAPKKSFEILIKPDFDVFDCKSPTGTDPELAEHLIDLLHARGCTRVTICGAKDSSDLWLENRDVMVLAEMAGYRYVTPAGHDYEVIDLAEDAVDAGFPEDCALRGTTLSRRWLDAHFRISFAKNKTDEEHSFALCLQNLLGVLPLRDKDFHYRHRLEAPDVCLALLRRTPVHFSMIDAFVSNHGSQGGRGTRALQTGAIIASADILLADLAASLKMQVDPYTSAINAKALREIGLPSRYEIIGDLAPYEGWKNVPPVLLDSVRKRNETAAGRLIEPWLQSVNRDLFPFKDALDDRVNAFAVKYFSDLDSNAALLSAMVALNYAIGGARESIEAWQILFGKAGLKWKDAPLDLDLAAYSPADYEAVVDYMEPLEKIIRHTGPEPKGLRWRYIDGSVLFELSQLVSARFKDFAARVDISKAVQSMNDYIGGACVPVTRDAIGRVTHQAERNIYLPQPNWMVIFGGKVIDVCKLEFVRYSPRSHRIFWRTLKSSNGSAEFDDGIVTFAAEKSHTRVTIVARQKFTLPLFWHAVNIDLAPQIKNPLVVQAYTTYFTRTIGNFIAQYEGRSYRVGRPWESAEPGEPGLRSILRAAGLGDGSLEKYLTRFSGITQRLDAFKSPNGAQPFIDEHGFRHFPGNANGAGKRDALGVTTVMGEARAFFAGLAEAVRKDLGVTDD